MSYEMIDKVLKHQLDIIKTLENLGDIVNDLGERISAIEDELERVKLKDIVYGDVRQS